MQALRATQYQNMEIGVINSIGLREEFKLIFLL